MSTVVVAKDPCLTFLITSRKINEKNDSPLPMILKKSGGIDWDANAYLTEIGGGSQVYNIKPLAKTVVKKAYSLNVFCSFLENKGIKLFDITNKTLYQFIDFLKTRKINDGTILSHGRVALGYIVYLSEKNPEWKLATSVQGAERAFNVHYQVKKFKRPGGEVEYFDHGSFVGLIHISVEAEYIHDHEFVMWLDAINDTTYHPVLSEFLISRWQTLSTLLDITGSRIGEIHQITKTSIKNASKAIFSEKNPIIRDIPILKGKFKGKNREVETTSEDLQILLWHINLVENMFPDVEHDAIFVDSKTGAPLKPSYLKNYAKKVINGSRYCNDLRHITNHSFRHRFITFHVAKAIKKVAASGSFNNILNVAATACRKVTMHASNTTLSRYIHLATELNHQSNQLNDALLEISSQIRMRVMKMLHIAESFKANQINDNEALESFLSNIEELRKLQMK
ncbi:site-specific integrase [Vibrio splendidus]|uniref:Site-specific integrase n=1 Tax=Vibrio splendidus TaxID=29497 RepID=A0A2T5EW26_VIBSP|nr:site-specific integrase [Vibrio splendidus]PTP35345.1 site-specific integrase [Vibrio splendidus]